MKRFLSIVMVFVMCIVCAVPVLASASTNNEHTTSSSRSMGYGSGSGYSSSFKVNVPSNGNYGKITLRITSPDQSQMVWLKVKDPNGRVVWDRSTYDTPGHTGLYPQNGNEIISPQFSNCVSGNYTVEFTSIVNVTVDCWIYNW